MLLMKNAYENEEKISLLKLPLASLTLLLIGGCPLECSILLSVSVRDFSLVLLLIRLF